MNDDIFVNEDISKPENRVNLALFHLQMNDVFHQWFCERLQLPVTSIIYPTKNINANRADYIVKEGDKILAYIEVELGNENKPQLSSYEIHNVRILSYYGKTISSLRF
ncbi:MAG: hypothetical protein WAX77_00735 [Methylococcaceae bacterium]